MSTATFDVNNVIKNLEKIIDNGPYKGSGVGNCHMQLIKGGVLAKDVEN